MARGVTGAGLGLVPTLSDRRELPVREAVRRVGTGWDIVVVLRR